MSKSNVLSWDDLQLEIQEKMLSLQAQQGNPRNPEVFRQSLIATKEEGGFDWVEDNLYDLWHNIICYAKTPEEALSIFRKQFPKALSDDGLIRDGYPKLMLVKSISEQWIRRTILGEKNGYYLYWDCVCNKIEDSKRAALVKLCTEVREIQTTVLTKAEVAEKLKIPVEELLISDLEKN